VHSNYAALTAKRTKSPANPRERATQRPTELAQLFPATSSNCLQCKIFASQSFGWETVLPFSRS
jgi:hypothetical protein